MISLPAMVAQFGLCKSDRAVFLEEACFSCLMQEKNGSHAYKLKWQMVTCKKSDKALF